MKDREKYDFSHYVFQAGAIGHLQTLNRLVTFPGDSISMYFNNTWSLSPLRKRMQVTAVIDIATFWVPMRHVYTNWKDFILGGYDEGETLSSHTHPASAAGAMCYGMNMVTGDSYPDWMLRPYNHIWNEYYRCPTVTPNLDEDWHVGDVAAPTGHTTANSPLGGGGNIYAYLHNGLPCARLKRPFTTGITTTITTADYQIDMSATHTLDLTALAAIKARYKTEQQRDWFAIRYRDILDHWGVDGVNIDADERPELINRVTYNLGGRDVDGTSDNNLGDSVGKSIENMDYAMPRKFFTEHGTLWTVALVRYPTILYNEAMPYELLANPSYNQFGDWEIALSEEPIADTLDNWTTDGGATSIGTIPFGQEWRHHRNHIHPHFNTVGGYPFQSTTDLNTLPKAQYIDSTRYDGMFTSLAEGHWQCKSAVEVQVDRHYPGPLTSVFAGTK